MFTDSVFADLLKFTCNLQIKALGSFVVIWGPAQSIEEFDFSDMHILSQVEQDNGDFLFPLSYYKQVSLFMVYLLPSFSHFCGGFVISLFEMAPKHKAEMLSSNPKFKKSAMCLLENMSVLDKLQSGMSYRAPGCEFRVNESTVCIQLCVFKHRHTLNKIMY